jgi:hypothetical protein
MQSAPAFRYASPLFIVSSNFSSSVTKVFTLMAVPSGSYAR